MPVKEPLRICVVGQQASGKSSLTLQFTNAHFPTDFDPTVEDVYEKNIEIDGLLCSLFVLDTACQDEYSPLKDRQYQEADGFIIAYSVGDLESFGNVTSFYRHITRVRGDELPPTIIVGLQADADTNRVVSYHQGAALAQELEIKHFIECSAKHNINVHETFVIISRDILTIKSQQSSDPVDKGEDSRQNFDSRTFTTSSQPQFSDLKLPSLAQVTSNVPSPSVERAPRAYNRDNADKVANSGNGCCIIM